MLIGAVPVRKSHPRTVHIVTPSRRCKHVQTLPIREVCDRAISALGVEAWASIRGPCNIYVHNSTPDLAARIRMPAQNGHHEVKVRKPQEYFGALIKMWEFSSILMHSAASLALPSACSSLLLVLLRESPFASCRAPWPRPCVAVQRA